jgi:hypothetical protein
VKRLYEKLHTNVNRKRVSTNVKEILLEREALVTRLYTCGSGRESTI